MTYNLDYLFIAESANGIIIKQNLDDISVINPAKSAFYDVLQNLPINKFCLVGRGNVFCIDLNDLHFEINNKVIPVHIMPPSSAKINLIYYREVIQTARSTLNKEKTLITHIIQHFIESKHEATHLRYIIGWEAYKNGKRCGREIMTIE